MRRARGQGKGQEHSGHATNLSGPSPRWTELRLLVEREARAFPSHETAMQRARETANKNRAPVSRRSATRLDQIGEARALRSKVGRPRPSHQATGKECGADLLARSTEIEVASVEAIKPCEIRRTRQPSDVRVRPSLINLVAVIRKGC